MECQNPLYIIYSQESSYSLLLPPNHPHTKMMPTSSEQPTVLTETQTLIKDLTAIGQSASHLLVQNPGLLLTMALQSPFKGLKYSTEVLMGGELEMLRCASQTSSQLLAARCFLAATSLAVLLDLPLMGNTLSSQVKSNCEMIISDAYPRSREGWQICYNSDG